MKRMRVLRDVGFAAALVAIFFAAAGVHIVHTVDPVYHGADQSFLSSLPHSKDCSPTYLLRNSAERRPLQRCPICMFLSNIQLDDSSPEPCVSAIDCVPQVVALVEVVIPQESRGPQSGPRAPPLTCLPVSLG